MSAASSSTSTSGMRQLRQGGLLFVAIVTIATIGYELAGWSWMDAFYMVIITIFGVGYGEVHPINTVALHFFTVGVIISGYIAAIYTFGGVIRIITEGEVKTMLNEIKHERNLDQLTDHTLICGYGRIGQILAKDLAARKHSFVIIDSDAGRIEKAAADGHLTLLGNATEEDTLRRAGIDRARNLATVLPQDELNVFITLTARDLNSTLRIIARGEQPNTERKLRQAGANEVIMPALIGGHRIAHALASPVLSDLLNDLRDSGAVGDLHRIGLDMVDIDLSACRQFVGMDLDTLQRRAGGMLIIALRRADGTFLESPDKALVCEVGDHIVAMAQPNRMPTDFLKPVVPQRRQYRGVEVE